MTSRTFFRWLWRFNALAIAGVAVLALVLGSYVALQLVNDAQRNRQVSAVVDVTPDDDADRSYTLGPPAPVEGHEIALISLLSAQRYIQGLRPKSTENNIVNIGFLDLKTAALTWLFDANDFLVLGTKSINTDMDYCAGTCTVAAHVITVVKGDTSDDDRLSASDSKTVMMTKPDGTGAVRVFSGIDAVRSTERLDDDTLLFMLQAADGYSLAAVSLSDFTIGYRKTIELPLD